MSKNFQNASSLIGKQVKVYRNLHHNCWSVQHRRLVVAHAQTVELRNVRFLVSQAGHERFLRENKKNVHAFVAGELVSLDGKPPPNLGVEVVYNPKVSNLFHTVEKIFKNREWFFSEKELLTKCWCSGKTVFVSNGFNL